MRRQGAVSRQELLVSEMGRGIRSTIVRRQWSTADSRRATSHRPSTIGLCSGFTLLEVLVALGLSVILLGAIYGAINLTHRLTTSGRERISQAQLVRAIFQQIDADVRSVVFAVQKDVASESGSGAAEDETDAETEIEPMTGDEAFTNASSGVYGDSQNLVLHVSRPSRQSRYVRPEGGAETADRSDLAAVSYFLAVRGASGLPGTVAQMAYDGSLLNAPRRGTVTGLTRLEGDRMAITFAEETGDIQTLAAAARILAPEVVTLSFAYWDGAEWTESWDTVERGELPRAIEITLGVDTRTSDADGTGDSPPGSRITITSAANDAEPTYYRHVVALPLAEPYVGELSQ